MSPPPLPPAEADAGAVEWMASRGHRFRDGALLDEALSHPSRASHRGGGPTYERLEFLGDAVLDLVIAEALFHADPTADEGALSGRHSQLARIEVAARIGEEIGIETWIRTDPTQRANVLARRERVLGDAVEALLGAVYLDAGWDAARRVARAWYGDLGARLGEADKGNPKGRLQEWLQARPALGAAEYAWLGMEGPGHQVVHRVELRLGGRTWGSGSGPRKRVAEEAAAAEALAALVAAEAAGGPGA